MKSLSVEKKDFGLKIKMDKIGMCWGSNTGHQEEAAGFLKAYMEWFC